MIPPSFQGPIPLDTPTPPRPRRSVVADQVRIGDYQIREYVAGDEHSIVATFNEVFHTSNTKRPKRHLDAWRHAFLLNPGGYRLRVAAHADQIVAQSAGLGYRADLEGRRTSFSQAVDSFVHPAHRNGLKNPGLFVSTVNAYVDAYSGHPDAMFFGWPNPVANRIGKRFLGYETVRKEHLLVRPLPGLPMEPLPEDPGFDASVFTLWKRCSKNYGASVVRDEPFLRWRFRDHPQFEYCYDILRNDKGAVRGYAIGRRTDRWLSRLYMIVDWLVVDDDLEAGEKLLRGAVAQAHGQGCTAIAGLFPEWSQWAEVLHARGFESFETEYELSVRSHDTRYGTDFYRDAWWYQLAESDIA